MEAKSTHRWIPLPIICHQTLKSAGANSRTLALWSCSNWLRCPRPGCHHLQNPLGYNWRQCRGSGCRQGFSGLVNDEKIAVWKALNQKRNGLRLIAVGNLLWHCLGKLLWSKGCWKKDSLQEWSSTRDMCNTYNLIATICRLHVIIRNWSFLTGKPMFFWGITITNYFGKHTNWDFLDVQMLQRHIPVRTTAKWMPWILKSKVGTGSRPFSNVMHNINMHNMHNVRTYCKCVAIHRHPNLVVLSTLKAHFHSRGLTCGQNFDAETRPPTNTHH